MRLMRLVGCLIAFGPTLAEAAEPAGLPRSEPEAQGVAAKSLLGFVEALDKSVEGMHGVVVVRHGHVILEGWWKPYAAETPHSLFSLSKSFTSTAVGLAISRGEAQPQMTR